MKKKITSLVLAAVMILTLLPTSLFTAFAATTAFNGVSIDYGNASVTAGDDYLTLIYKNVGSSQFIIPDGYKAVADILVVGGGGSGSTGKKANSGTTESYKGSGGSGGEVRLETGAILPSGEYSVTVGKGGASVKAGSSTARTAGESGNPSSLAGPKTFDGIIAKGGAGGVTESLSDGQSAANNESNITGTLTTYGVGGLKSSNATAAGADADANTGNGGGGGGRVASDSKKSGAGGSGIVVVRLTNIVQTHDHSFTYTANGDTLTATCSAEDCPNGLDETPLTLSLNEDGYLDAEELKMWKAHKATVPEVTYYLSDDLETELPYTLFAAGDYIAVATIGGVTVKKNFTLTEDVPYDGKMANAGGTSDAIRWKLDSSTGTLTIFGFGAIPEMDWYKYPWIGQTSANTTAQNKAKSIKHLVIGDGVTNLPKFFSGSTSDCYYNNLKDIVIKSKNFEMNFAQAMCSVTALESVTFDEGVESISITGGNTFQNCTALTKVNLPSTLKSFKIAPTTFNGSTAFSTITLPEENENFHLIDGALYDGELTTLLLAPNAQEITPVPGVKRIASSEKINISSMFAPNQIDDNIEITLKHNKDGQTASNDQFYVGDMIKAEVTAKDGELPDGLFYAWLGYANSSRTSIDNGKTAKIAGFETPDTYIDGDEYVVSPNALYGAVKITYFPYDNKGYYGTAYCRFAVCRVVDGLTKIVAYKDFTAVAASGTGTTGNTYNAALKYIADGNTVTMIKGETRSIQELLGRCGITHVTCSAVTTSNISVNSGSSAISLSGNNITAGDGTRANSISFKIDSNNCLYHATATNDTNTLSINVIDDPQIETTCTTVTVNAPEEDYDYFIGQTKGVLENGKICFSGLTPETEYIVRMQITGEYGEATYTNAVKVKTTAHDFSDIRDNGNGTHSTYCVNGCGECVDTEEHNFDDGECTVCHATEHTIPETTYTIVIPKEVSVNSKGITTIGKPTVKDVENADGKVITYTAEGTDFAMQGDSTKTVKAAYYTAYTDADNNTPLGNDSFTVYDGGYIDNEALTALYVFISDEEWEKAENGIYKATVTYTFVAQTQ